VRKTASLLGLAVAFLALGGCQSLFSSPSFASRAPAAESTSIDMSDYFTARLEAGRTHLAHGRPAAAVIAFRQASYDPAHAGPAFNGMGVAYAQMGRQDLARRYFTMAVAIDPLDERFARNLARLENDAVSDSIRSAFAEAGNAPPEVSPQQSSDTVRSAQDSGMRRVSSREVEIFGAAALRSDKIITTVRPQPAEQRSSSAIARSDRAATYPIRIALPRAEVRPTADYPVRIALADVEVTQRSDYPIRIELPNSR
jgi:hypothetical protein